MEKLKIKILKKIVEIDGGGVTKEHIDKLAKNDNELKVIQELISKNYIDEYIKKHLGYNGGQIEVTYFRISEKGYNLIDPFYKKCERFIKKIIIPIIMILITAVVTYLLH